jgi:hypothetical protein
MGVTPSTIDLCLCDSFMRLFVILLVVTFTPSWNRKKAQKGIVLNGRHAIKDSFLCLCDSSMCLFVILFSGSPIQRYSSFLTSHPLFSRT